MIGKLCFLLVLQLWLINQIGFSKYIYIIDITYAVLMLLVLMRTQTI